MADAKKLMPFILEREGGFSDNPKDRGGATNKGVTLATFRQYYGQTATVAQLRAMTDDQWAHIFKSGYWDKFRGDEIESQAVADMCVDWAWHSGTATAARQVQRVLGVAADGVVGPKTVAAINAADPAELFGRLKRARLAFVEGIVRRDPSQRVFLRGWKNRINALAFAVVLFMVLVFSACRPSREAAAPVYARDSVRTVVRYERVEVPDTVLVEIPPQAAERLTADSVSWLENGFAVSVARVDSVGRLFHSLRTKEGGVPVPSRREVVRRDSVVFVDRAAEVPVPVARELARWERVCVKWFPYALGALALAVVYILRKPFLALARRYI